MANKKENQAIGLDVQLNKSEAFIEKNFKKLGIGLLAVIVVVVGFYIFNRSEESKENDAAKAIAKSEAAFNQQKYEQALNGDGPAEKGFLKVISEFSGTKTANVAKLYAGLCYFYTEKYDDAIKMLESFKPAKDVMISPAAIAALGHCYVEKGQADKGAETLIKAAKMANNDATSPVYLLQAGEVYETMQKFDKAVELYKEIKEKYYLNSVSNDIDKYIERASN